MLPRRHVATLNNVLAGSNRWLRTLQPMVSVTMSMNREEQYDDAMFDFSAGNFDSAITKLKAILKEDASHFDAQLSLGMAYYRKGDFPAAIAEGHKAEQLRPREQLVHTNLSLFYMRSGDKQKAEHHGLQARIASWREDKSPPGAQVVDPDLAMAKAPTPPINIPDMPWKKKSK